MGQIQESPEDWHCGKKGLENSPFNNESYAYPIRVKGIQNSKFMPPKILGEIGELISMVRYLLRNYWHPEAAKKEVMFFEGGQWFSHDTMSSSIPGQVQAAPLGISELLSIKQLMKKKIERGGGVKEALSSSQKGNIGEDAVGVRRQKGTVLYISIRCVYSILKFKKKM